MTSLYWEQTFRSPNLKAPQVGHCLAAEAVLLAAGLRKPRGKKYALTRRQRGLSFWHVSKLVWHTLMDTKKRCPPLLTRTILSRSQEVLSGLNLEHVALTFVMAATQTRAPRAGSAPAPARRPFAAPSRSSHLCSCSCSCSEAGPARSVSDTEEAATIYWTVSGLFWYVGLDRVCDERGWGSEWVCAPETAVGG